MSGDRRPGDRRVVIVTGGGGGIGAAIATELGRRGDHVVTVDPLVSVDGTAAAAPAEETTAGRIVAAGGSAQASGISVTDRDAVHDLVAALVATHGRLDGVVNVAGITRPTGFASGDEADWSAVAAVHLDGYRNLLDAALPVMAAAGRGRIVGVTSGSGWRAADAGAYSAAKRAVASLTWELGRVAPPGVAVNAISPIAMTRMVTEAMARAKAARRAAGGQASSSKPSPSPSPSPAAGSAGPSGRTGGLSLGSMPAPEHLGPFGAFLVGDDLAGVQGRVLFTAGSEVAVVDPPRLLEVVRTHGVADLEALLGSVADALAGAHTAQATGGGANPRFGAIFDGPGADADGSAAGVPGGRGAALVVTDRPALGSALASRLEASGRVARSVVAGPVGPGVAAATAALADAAAGLGRLDVVVVALAASTHATDDDGGAAAVGSSDGWEGVLASHDGLVDGLLADAAWARAVADHAAARPDGAEAPALRLVTLVEASTAGGRSRAQAASQLARVSRAATAERVTALAVALEAPGEVDAVAALVRHLATHPTADALAGAELVVGAGWLGVRSHPRPAGTIVFGGPDLPPWFGAALAEIASP